MIDVVLETERLALRKMTAEDVDNLQLIFGDPVAMFFYEKTLTREETKRWIDKILNNYETRGAGLWACDLKSTGEFVGQCGLNFQPNIDGQEEVEISYLFLRKYWSQGFATEAAKAVMDYARQHLGLHRIISLVRPENLPSRRVAEKNGFAIEKEVLYKGIKHIVYVSTE